MRGTQEGDRLVAEIISAAGGRVVGRVRLQKIFYLLDRLGLGSGLDYDYHHYGPYSAELAEAVEDATAFGMVDERIERRSYDGVPYSIFQQPRVTPGPQIGQLECSKAVRALRRMQAETATVLELAATIDWLKNQERVDNWEHELVRRKGAKAEQGRVQQAQQLLRALDLDG
jgi:uncharacterized protein YwgA